MIYGFIICAGKQSRFKLQTPKALIEINGEKLLDINIRRMSNYCDKVIIVCSHENAAFFNGYKNVLEIESGKGSGDAILVAMRNFTFQDNDACFIQWGDSLQESVIYQSLIKNFNGVALIPCVIEESPYVQIKQRKKQVQVLFSKFRDEISRGYHDLSVFFCPAKSLLYYLEDFFKRFSVLGEYRHQHNNEFEFLDVFNDTKIEARILDMGDYKSFSFNTIEQFNELNKKGNNE